MTSASSFAVTAGVVVLGLMTITDTGELVSAQDQKNQVVQPDIEYKALRREQIEELAPEESKGRTDDLTHGLNALAEDGWRLETVEPFHAQTRGPVTTYFPATYIFAR